MFGRFIAWLGVGRARFIFGLLALTGLLSLMLNAVQPPEAWHARYQEDLGVRAPDDRDGVLQDVHWYSGLIGGAFQGYTLGNILGAQFYAKALAERPEIADEIGRGTFETLHGWLREHIYQHGSKYTAPELIARTVGKIEIAPYIGYLRQKYGALYHL